MTKERKTVKMLKEGKDVKNKQEFLYLNKRCSTCYKKIWFISGQINTWILWGTIHSKQHSYSCIDCYIKWFVENEENND